MVYGVASTLLLVASCVVIPFVGVVMIQLNNTPLLQNPDRWPDLASERSQQFYYIIGSLR